MNIDVAKAIKELLFEHDAVILPGLGGFTSSPEASAIDYVQGTVKPPTRKVEFNTNLVINDGLLVNHIQQNEVVTAQEATVAIENFVEMIKDALEQREIVDIPQVGRLYRDYEQKIRFMPEGTNFETESFGLPTIKFNPIVRKKADTETTATASGNAKPKAYTPPVRPASNQEISWAEKILPTLIIIAAALLAISLFAYVRGCSSSTPADVPQERVNVKPGQDDIAEIDNQASTETDTAARENRNKPDISTSSEEESTGEDSNNYTSENSTNPPASTTEKSIFIVVHSFGNKENARKFARELERAGYTPTTKFNAGLNRVGIEVPATRNDEVTRLIEDLGKKFKSSPVVVDY